MLLRAIKPLLKVKHFRQMRSTHDFLLMISCHGFHFFHRKLTEFAFHIFNKKIDVIISARPLNIFPVSRLSDEHTHFRLYLLFSNADLFFLL